MKVSELISILQQLPGNAEVHVSDVDYIDVPANSIFFNPECLTIYIGNEQYFMGCYKPNLYHPAP